jgi:hypothetical protein
MRWKQADVFRFNPDHPIFGCNRLGHSVDENGDCRHCDYNAEDDEVIKEP